MELKLINEQGLEASRLEASDTLFGREYNEALVHQVLVAYQANGRSGNRAQKAAIPASPANSTAGLNDHKPVEIAKDWRRKLGLTNFLSLFNIPPHTQSLG